jgi:hypothetical protein
MLALLFSLKKSNLPEAFAMSGTPDFGGLISWQFGGELSV